MRLAIQQRKLHEAGVEDAPAKATEEQIKGFARDHNAAHSRGGMRKR